MRVSDMHTISRGQSYDMRQFDYDAVSYAGAV